MKESFGFNSGDDIARQVAWPSEDAVPGFKKTALTEHSSQECKGVVSHLLDCLSLALALPPELHLLRHHSHANDTCSLLHYPAVPASDSAVPVVRHPAHADFGTLTLLFQDNVGGLEIAEGVSVAADDEVFRAVPPAKDLIVVNAGYLLMRWSNQRWKSSIHRVCWPASTKRNRFSKTIPERYSIAFFSHPDDATVIDALPGCHGESRGKLFPPLDTGEYLRRRRTGMYTG